MRNRVNQIYEAYWNYTAAFTDFNGDKFLRAVKTCVEFIDANPGGYDPSNRNDNKYHELQLYFDEKCRVNAARLNDRTPSYRKMINQLVKIGVIKPFLRGYPYETLQLLEAKTAARRKSVLSKIVYKYANICNATTVDLRTQQLAFFLKSLEEIGSFTELDLATLMTINIEDYEKGYITRPELNEQYNTVDIEGFVSRKYNQISHLKNLLGKLDDLIVVDNVIYFETDALRIFGDEIEKQKECRDPYLQRVYKKELEEESMFFMESTSPKCMLEGLDHPVLIASHIKPYKVSNEQEEFDVNNGLLLSKNLDSLFDLGYMTFNSDGTILPSKVLSADMKAYLSTYRLNPYFINEKRMEYMKYHRAHVFEKRFARRVG
jgi:hypothetical protein